MPHKILVADDSQTIQKVIKITLSGEQFSIVSCLSEEDFLEKINDDIDLVLLDFNLSESISGYQLIKEARDKNSETPFLVMLGTFDQVESELLEEYGANETIVKPFDSGEFLTACHKLLNIEIAADQSTESSNLVSKDNSNSSIVMSNPMQEELESWGMEVPEPIQKIDMSIATQNLFPPQMDESVEEQITGYEEKQVNNQSSNIVNEEFEDTSSDFEMKSLVNLEPDLESELSSKVTSEINPDSFWDTETSGQNDDASEDVELSDGSTLEELDITYGENFGSDFSDLEASDDLEELSPNKSEVLSGPENEIEKPSIKPEISNDQLEEMVKDAVRELCAEKIESIVWEIVPELAENLIKKEIKEIRESIN